MKKMIIIAIVFGLTDLAFSQNFGIDVSSPIEKLDVNGNANVRGDIYSSSKIGIGTTSPSQKLDVSNGAIALSGATGFAHGILLDRGSAIPTSGLQASIFQEWNGIGGSSEALTFRSDNYKFQNFDGSDEIVFLNGNIGIRTLSPAYNLQVGQQTAGDNSNYSLGILRHGTGASPGAYTANNPVLTISDLSDDGPGVTETTGLLNISAGRIADLDPNAGNANLLSIQNDNGHALVVKGNRTVGIGTNTPTAGFRLEVVGAARIGTTGGISILSLDANSANIRPSIGNGDILISDDSGSPTRGLTVANGGSVGILTAAPAFSLEVNGSAGKPGGGSWAASSDIRLKKDIIPFTDGLALLLSINPVRYQYNEKSGYDTIPQYVGVIAQELNEVAPYMVSTYTKEGEEYLRVDPSAMTYMLINAVKEQQEQINQLTLKNNSLEMHNARLHSDFDKLRTENIEALEAMKKEIESLKSYYYQNTTGNYSIPKPEALQSINKK